MNVIKKQTGISLVELLIGLVLGLFLTGGAIQTFMVTKTSYRFNDAMSRVQENGRFSLEMITRDLRMTGFFGCASFDAANINDSIIDTGGTDYDAILHAFDTPLDGTNNTENGGTSDRLILKGAIDETYLLSSAAASTTADFLINVGNGITADDIVAVGDCERIDIFQVTGVAASATTTTLSHAAGTTDPGNTTATMSKVYGTDAQIAPISVIQYFIAPGATNEPSLFRSVNGVDEELLSGVEDMQILYGEDTDADGTPNRFVDASSATLDMNDVLSVRISLLIRSSEDNVTEDPQVYTFNGATVTAADNRIRQVFSSTISLRNRLL